jgi:DNA-binding NarL/FixJ family response regulator
MILALVDDLLFGSRIRAVADRAGRKVVFAGRGSVARDVRDSRPDLIIIDLDRSAQDPMAAIRAIKADADPAVSSVTIVGFVSHVRGDLIDAARAAGIDQVLARSAFVTKLPELVAATPADRPADAAPAGETPAS